MLCSVAVHSHATHDKLHKFSWFYAVIRTDHYISTVTHSERTKFHHDLLHDPIHANITFDQKLDPRKKPPRKKPLAKIITAKKTYSTVISLPCIFLTMIWYIVNHCWWFLVRAKCGNELSCTCIQSGHVKYGLDVSRLTWSKYFEMTNDRLASCSYNNQIKIFSIDIHQQ